MRPSFHDDYQKGAWMDRTPNKAAARERRDCALAPIEHHRRGVGEPRRSAGFRSSRHERMKAKCTTKVVLLAAVPIVLLVWLPSVFLTPPKTRAPRSHERNIVTVQVEFPLPASTNAQQRLRPSTPGEIR